MLKKGLIGTLLQESIEFCYTQETGVLGISKNAITEKYKVYSPNVLISTFKATHGIELSFISDDATYIYVKVK